MKFILFFLLVIFSFMNGCGQENYGECNPQAKYLIVTPYAGMGNRLRVLASAKIMAALTDRHLVVIWNVIPNELPGTWKDFFLNPMTMFGDSSLPKEGCTLKRIEEAKEHDPIIKNLGSQNRENNKPSEEILSKIPEYKEPIVYFGTSLPFRPIEELMSDAEYEKRYRIFYQSLDPYAWVTKALKDFEMEHHFEDYFMIGVHYRAWSTGIPDNTQGVSVDPEYRYLERFIEALKSEVKKPLSQTDYKPVAFFLSADDLKVKEKLLAVPEFKGRIFTRNEKIDRSTVYGQQEALLDWFLLGATNFIIGTYQSSFSDEAAHLTKQGRKINASDEAYRNK